MNTSYPISTALAKDNPFWMRYWVYYTTADYLGLFIGLMIYGFFYYPLEYADAYRLPPDFMQLMSAAGSTFYLWYVSSFYLVVQLIAFMAFKNDARNRYDYRAHFRIIVLMIHAGTITGFMTTPNEKQVFIPLGCILITNVIAFLLLENRERRLS